MMHGMFAILSFENVHKLCLGFDWLIESAICEYGMYIKGGSGVTI